MMNIPELSMEQQFELRVVQEAVTKMTHDQLQVMVVEATRLVMLKDNVVRELINEKIGRETRGV